MGFVTGVCQNLGFNTVFCHLVGFVLMVGFVTEFCQCVGFVKLLVGFVKFMLGFVVNGCVLSLVLSSKVENKFKNL